MEQFPVAHLNVQNVNVIIIFLNQQFDRMTPADQHAVHRQLQTAATSAGLAGNVVPVWQDAFATTKFISPLQQHQFFRSTSYEALYAHVNRTLTING
jgi:hypothetical protein